MAQRLIRRFTIRKGNAKTMYFTLLGQDRRAQELPPGSTATFSMWRDGELPLKRIDAAACVIDDDGTEIKRGKGHYTFTALASAALPAGVYEGRVDAMVGGAIPLTFPDDDGRLDPSRKLLITVTEQV
jgi:hypothetical protein